ncbi:MAG: bifunctional diaminohydroxyphosphoribosylaminopyrimidine deaminase/5-amino-6-(5-phosphoribosylamino)uracil reductase RibD [Myxococcaceae bacterium]|jgi:diaminohydroxyphosphoribosylaminopyrimidine deaminase/5-amino-6-(5-phosphoribosylamino)uracil reductase|nr:bifunctional diaminohydroxyphosphoribosylaminopyrimidine deaminase/5-amino-6-(5-phosphoribosylamino)uracil reductase RibD [Myxococcaceae bacterium]
MAFRADDERFMRLALDEARKGLGRTHPNPAVGAVIVKAGKVIATGYHARAGTAHAEANALMLAGAKAKGATIYSTLEPCDHFGRTPPCTQAILDHGLSRVVYGSSDPNPLVDGKGVRRLKRAGLAVTGGVLAAECDALNEPFFKVMRTGLPFVTVKAGLTLDGKIATAAGQSKWITSEAARAHAHALRDRVDAVVVGAGTVVADDPALTTRIPGGRDAMRVVIDPQLRTKPTAKVYAANGPRVMVVTARPADSARARAFARRGVQVVTVSERKGRLELETALRALVKLGVLHLLVEGGATTTGRFFEAGLVDELVLFIAPKVFGAEGLSWVGALGVRQVADAPGFRVTGLEQVGDDVMLRVRPRKP